MGLHVVYQVVALTWVSLTDSGFTTTRLTSLLRYTPGKGHKHQSNKGQKIDLCISEQCYLGSRTQSLHDYLHT